MPRVVRTAIPAGLFCLRIAIQATLFFLLLGVVVAISGSETSVLEKLLLAAFGALLIWIAVLVRHLGDSHGRPSH